MEYWYLLAALYIFGGVVTARYFWDNRAKNTPPRLAATVVIILGVVWLPLAYLAGITKFWRIVN